MPSSSRYSWSRAFWLLCRLPLTCALADAIGPETKARPWPRRVAKILQLAALAASVLSADVLKLRNGQQWTGTYLGGDARQIRFAVGDAVRTVAISDVAQIDFGALSDSSQAAAAPRVTVTPAESQSDQQHRVCDIVGCFQRASLQYAGETNPLRRSQVKAPNPFDYEEELVQILGRSGEFRDWRGKVGFRQESEYVSVSFYPECLGLAPRYLATFSEIRVSSAQGR